MSDRITNSIAREIRRRVERKPGAKLLLHTLRLVPIPGTPHKATVFIYELDNKLHFVCELALPDLPHIYNSYQMANGSAREMYRALASNLARLSHTVNHDPRFNRGRIITLNGFHR